MARKLKTYQTSLGFFEQAIAAPSMKAALEAWGADSNLFHQGVAKESHDPDVIAATMAKPGVVLKRPVGSDGPFSEHAELPKNLGDGGQSEKAARKSDAAKRRSTAHRHGGGPESRASVRTGTPAPRARGGKGGGGQAEEERTKTAGRRRRPKRHWTRPSENTSRGPTPSETRRRPSKRGRKPRRPAGSGRRGTSIKPSGRPEIDASARPTSSASS